MNKLRYLFTCLIVLLVAFFTIGMNVSAATGAAYAKSEELESNSLDYGITHRIEKGATKTAKGSTYSNQVINVLEVPSDTTYRVTSWMNYTGNRWNLANVKKMMEDFEAKNPGWKAIAGVNGDFFDISKTGNFPGQTTGAMAGLGNFYKQNAHKSYYSVGFANDGSTDPLVAEVNPKKTENMVLAVYDENDNIIGEYDVQKLNAAPEANQSAVYFGVFNSAQVCVPVTTSSDADTTVYRVDQALVSLPNSASDYYGLGVISSIGDGVLDDGQFAIATKDEAVKAALAIGTKIRIQYEWAGAFENIGDVVSAGSAVVLNGEVPSNANTADGDRMNSRHPRTAVGVKANGTIVLTVVDGRNESHGRYGVYGDELGAVMAELGCVEAYNLDGGGSSAMVIREGDEFVVKNMPSDGSPRADGNVIIVAVQMPEFTTEVVEATRNSVTLKFDFQKLASLDINNLVVRNGSKTFDVVDNQVTITSLTSNTNYTMQLCYKNPRGTVVKTYSKFDVLCPPTEYKIRKLEFEEQGDQMVFELDFSDRDKTTNLAQAKILINGKEYQLTDAKVSVPTAEVGKVIYEIALVFDLTVAGEIKEVKLVNPHSVFLKVASSLVDERQDILSNIKG